MGQSQHHPSLPPNILHTILVQAMTCHLPKLRLHHDPTYTIINTYTHPNKTSSPLQDTLVHHLLCKMHRRQGACTISLLALHLMALIMVESVLGPQKRNTMNAQSAHVTRHTLFFIAPLAQFIHAFQPLLLDHHTTRISF